MKDLIDLTSAQLESSEDAKMRDLIRSENLVMRIYKEYLFASHYATKSEN